MPPDDRKTSRTSTPVGHAGGIRGATGNARSRGPASQGQDGLGEVYFEFRPVGSYMRVNAIHAATGQETFVLGPLNASRTDLQMLALRKLKNLIGS